MGKSALGRREIGVISEGNESRFGGDQTALYDADTKCQSEFEFCFRLTSDVTPYSHSGQDPLMGSANSFDSKEKAPS